MSKNTKTFKREDYTTIGRKSTGGDKKEKKSANIFSMPEKVVFSVTRRTKLLWYVVEMQLRKQDLAFSTTGFLKSFRFTASGAETQMIWIKG